MEEKTGFNKPEDDGYIYPSMFRKIIVLVVWYLITVIVLMFIAHFIAGSIFNIPVDDNEMTPGWFKLIKNIIQFGSLGILALLALRGKLPGSGIKRKNS
ncbi:MAG TPA: hypothetical protein PKC91_13245 [Ignavibacteria bacterium]|nr:hypothetical protein [Ignavibacteria bacterium]